MLYIIAIAGVLLHVLMKFRDAYTKHELFDWKRQLIFSLLSVPCVLVIIYFKDVFIQLNDISIVNDPKIQTIIQKLIEFICFFLGYFSDSVWKNMEKTGRTTIKVNEDQPVNSN